MGFEVGGLYSRLESTFPILRSKRDWICCDCFEKSFQGSGVITLNRYLHQSSNTQNLRLLLRPSNNRPIPPNPLRWPCRAKPSRSRNRSPKHRSLSRFHLSFPLPTDPKYHSHQNLPHQFPYHLSLTNTPIHPRRPRCPPTIHTIPNIPNHHPTLHQHRQHPPLPNPRSLPPQQNPNPPRPSGIRRVD